MSLDLKKLHKLRDKGFVNLYTDQRTRWVEMVNKAKDYAMTIVAGGERIRPGDVAGIIQHAISVDPFFEAHVKGRHLTQNYWVSHFADYILDQAYPPRPIH